MRQVWRRNQAYFGEDFDARSMERVALALRAVADHPKLSRLKSLLKCGRGEAMGYLEALWHFTGRFTPQGNIGKYSDAEVESWIEWSGDGGKLIEALVEAGWIDMSQTHRLLIHDWQDHADDATKLALKRKKCGFINNVETPSPQSPDTVPTPSRLPEPVPEPEPEPEGEATAPPPEPARRAPQARPGANGEFLAAMWLLQELGIASHASDISVIAQVIAFEARSRGDTRESAEWILQETCKARERGEHITVFWLKDRKFSAPAGKDIYAEYLAKG